MPMSPPQDHPKCYQSKLCKRAVAFYIANEFMILAILAIILAKAYPPLGATYLKPKLTASWIAVIFIFLLAGLVLRTEEFANAFVKVYFNLFVQFFTFGVVSSMLFGFSRLMIEIGAISKALGDGMAICGCLSTTINMSVVMTIGADGDEAAAIFNATFGNIVGIFLTPFLILGYIGSSGGVPIGKTIYTLTVRVLTPIFIGQVLRKTSSRLVALVKKYKLSIDKSREYTLVFIIYTSFCTTFAKGHRSNAGDLCLLIFFQFTLLCTAMVLAWTLLRVLFPKDPKLCVMGLIGCTQKTLAVGLPLISAIYAGNKNLGPYTLPLLIWYTSQFIIGTALTPRLKAFVEEETKRLGSVNENPEVIESEAKNANAEVVIEIPEVIEPVGFKGETAEALAIDDETLGNKA